MQPSVKSDFLGLSSNRNTFMAGKVRGTSGVDNLCITQNKAFAYESLCLRSCTLFVSIYAFLYMCTVLAVHLIDT